MAYVPPADENEREIDIVGISSDSSGVLVPIYYDFFFFVFGLSSFSSPFF